MWPKSTEPLLEWLPSTHRPGSAGPASTPYSPEFMTAFRIASDLGMINPEMIQRFGIDALLASGWET